MKKEIILCEIAAAMIKENAIDKNKILNYLYDIENNQDVPYNMALQAQITARKIDKGDFDICIEEVKKNEREKEFA